MEKLFLWGTGIIAKQIFRECELFTQYDILGFIDNDKKKAGTIFQDKKIFLPEILHEIIPDRIVILTDSYKEIKEQILQEFSEFSDKIENKNFFYKQIMKKRYKDSLNLEIREVMEYLEWNNLQVFNYAFARMYDELKINIFYDVDCGMFFVYHKRKKLYFAKFLDSEQKILKYYRNILMEQDENSPHRYLDTEFDVKDGDVVIDIGVAEGNFSLDIIDKVSKLYLIEADEEWIEALRETFKEYQDKVVIIKKYITSIDEGKYATLDNLIDKPVDFIKMDIEGNEWDALLGAEHLIKRSPKVKCAICTYHGDFDEILVKDVLERYEMNCSTTKGYMWFPEKIRQTYVSTRLCRGVVRAEKGKG